MKKVIVAAAGLMLAGVMTSTAFADVSFSGDARARFRYFDEYQGPSTKDSHFDSRARLAFVGETKGGAYAKARFTLASGKWNGTNVTRGPNNVSVDYAYLGIPLGPITVEAGAYDDRGITPFTIFAQDVDTLQFIYEAGETKLTAFMDGMRDDINPNNNDDALAFGLVLNQSFACGATLDAGVRYLYDSISGNPDGIIAGLDVSGEFGGMTLAGGLGYKEKDFTGTGDDGYGLWARLDAPVGAATATVILGATFDGYTAEWGEFDAFYMFGDYTMISVGGSQPLAGDQLGRLGDVYFGVLRGTYNASEKLELAAQIAYADVDYGAVLYDGGAFEIGAKASYTILDGAKLNAMLGYADLDDLNLNPLAFALSLEVKF